MKKLVLILLAICIAGPAAAETWKDQELREERELKLKLRQSQPYDPSQQQNNRQTKDLGPCMGDCGSDEGICISYCGNNGQCIARCAETQGRCVARCY